jgi:hypothetical protein
LFFYEVFVVLFCFVFVSVCNFFFEFRLERKDKK